MGDNETTEPTATEPAIVDAVNATATAAPDAEEVADIEEVDSCMAAEIEEHRQRMKRYNRTPKAGKDRLIGRRTKRSKMIYHGYDD